MNDESASHEQPEDLDAKWTQAILELGTELREYALRLTNGDYPLACDLVQTTYKRALRTKNKPPADDKNQLRAWLKRIVKNEFLRHRGKQNPITEIEEITSHTSEEGQTTIHPSASDIIEALHALKENCEKGRKRLPYVLSSAFDDEILYVLCRLDELTLDIVVLHIFQHKPLKEISDICDIKYDTIKSKYYRFHQYWWVPIRVIKRLQFTDEYRQMHRLLHQYWVGMCYTLVEYAHNNCYNDISDRFERADLIYHLLREVLNRGLRDIFHYDRGRYRTSRVHLQYILDYLIQLIIHLCGNR